MKKKLDSLRDFYKRHPKRFWVIGIIVLIIVLMTVFGGKDKETVTISEVTRTDLKETVLATGQVTSKTDLSLSFSSSDIVRSVSVVVGSKVYQGQALASLDNRDEYAGLKAAQARYNKVAEGASTEEVAVVETQLASAKSDLANKKRTQDTLVENAYLKLLNTDLTPSAISGSATNPPTVTGTYTSSIQGEYIIKFYTASSGTYYTYEGLETGSGAASSATSVALGTRGLYIQFPASVSTDSTWVVTLPNMKATTYVANRNGYEDSLRNRDSSIAAAEASVREYEAQLALKKAAARPADLDVAEAEVLSATAAYENTILRAPASGTITLVDIKIGQRAEPQKTVMVLQDVSSLYVEADINEANIAKVALGQKVSMTFDAFGPTTTFSGTVAHIDPSATTDDGVVNYKIKASIDAGDKKDVIRPGMNANMTITASEKAGVIAIPRAALVMEEGKYFANIITNEKHKKYERREVTIGQEGDGNLVEILTGLTEGEKIAIVAKK